MQIELSATQVGVLKKALYQAEDLWRDAYVGIQEAVFKALSTEKGAAKDDLAAMEAINRDINVLMEVMNIVGKLTEEPNLPSTVGEMFPDGQTNDRGTDSGDGEGRS